MQIRRRKGDLLDNADADGGPKKAALIRWRPAGQRFQMNEAMADVSRHVWETKYRYAHERSITDSRRRIAGALAAVEPNDPVGWEARFLRILEDFKFLPGGRIQAGAGTARNVTLFNCFVMGPIEELDPRHF